MTKAVSALGGALLLFLVINQFIAYFNYSNIPTLMAVAMADVLKSANVGTVWLLVGFVVVVTILNIFRSRRILRWSLGLQRSTKRMRVSEPSSH
jgi:aminobenzoyl-glutamate transport protein